MKRQNGITWERALFVVIGMALFWQILRFRNVTEMLPYGSAGLPCFVGALAVVAVAAALWPMRFERLSSSLLVVGLCAVAAAGSLALLWAACLAGWWGVDSAVACLLAALSGASEAVLLVAWYTQLGRIGSTDDWPIMAMLFGSAVFGLFIAVILFSLSPVAGLFPVLVPLLAALCLGACSLFGRVGRSRGNNDDAADCGEEGVRIPPSLRTRLLSFGAPPSGMLLVLLAALSLLGNLVLAFSSGSAVVQEDYTLWLKYVISMALIAAAFVLLHRCENERKTSFAIGLGLAFTLVGGMALLGTGNTVAQSVGVALVTSCKTCIEVLVLFLLVRDSFDCRVAYGNFLLLFVLPVAVAFLAGQCGVPALLGATIPLGEAQVAGLSMLLSVLTLVVLAVGLAIIAIRSFNFEVTPDCADCSEPLETPVSAQAVERGAGLPDEVLECVAVDYGLTIRETQVLVYAFRGYSLQHIADLDVVSLNTVKSHWKNLYRKLDVHTRQELIDLVEARLHEGAPLP